MKKRSIIIKPNQIAMILTLFILGVAFTIIRKAYIANKELPKVKEITKAEAEEMLKEKGNFKIK